MNNIRWSISDGFNWRTQMETMIIERSKAMLCLQWMMWNEWYQRCTSQTPKGEMQRTPTHPGAEGAGKILRFWSPPRRKSSWNRHIPAPKAPGKFRGLEYTKCHILKKSTHPGAEGAGEKLRFWSPPNAESLRNSYRSPLQNHRDGLQPN